MYGLTGGIASGKSSVAKMLAELGMPVVDADELARTVVAVGSPALNEIARAFGPHILLPDGSLDRKKLGALVFADEERRKELNAITHPRIAQLCQAELATLASAGHGSAIYEAALIVENKIHESLAGLIVVAVSEEEQLARLRARDQLSEEAARERLASQAPLAEKLAAADHVIDNSGSLSETRAQVEALYENLKSLETA